MKVDKIIEIERYHMDNLKRILKSKSFKDDLKNIESYIVNNYQNLHYHWGIKNKLKLAAERLIRFYIWKNYGSVDLYNTPLSSDVAFVLEDCVINIDCKTIDLSGNKNDRKYIQCEANQANFENIELQNCFIDDDEKLLFEGYKFYPTLEKFYNSKPVLSFFIFINYHDDGNEFSIEELEICCLPHDEVVKKIYNSKLISGFKTYKYLKEMQAEKFDKYYSPTKLIKHHWIKFKVGQTIRYYDSKRMHPFDKNKLLIWGLEGKHWQVVLGGHTIRVPKNSIKNRLYNGSQKWLGWEKIEI
jgi:hypothetical protein